MKARSLNLVLIAFVLLLALPQAGQARAAAVSPRPVAANPLLPPVEARQPGNVTPASGYSVYLPFVAKPLNCYTGSPYSAGPAYHAEPPLLAANHPDKNLALRTQWVDTGNTYTKALAHLGSVAGDPNAPRLSGLFSPPTNSPTVAANNEVQYWDGTLGHMGPVLAPAPNCPLPAGHVCPQVSLVWFQSAVAQKIYVPNSGYTLGAGMEVLVLYADSNQITLKYTRDDSVAVGYTLHIEGICVDPNLLTLYQSTDQCNWSSPNASNCPRYYASQFSLPNLAAGQAIGVSKATTFGVAIRDTGAFMDPRNLDDWWH